MTDKCIPEVIQVLKKSHSVNIKVGILRIVKEHTSESLAILCHTGIEHHKIRIRRAIEGRHIKYLAHSLRVVICRIRRALVHQHGCLIPADTGKPLRAEILGRHRLADTRLNTRRKRHPDNSDNALTV